MRGPAIGGGIRDIRLGGGALKSGMLTCGGGLKIKVKRLKINNEFIL